MRASVADSHCRATNGVRPGSNNGAVRYRPGTFALDTVQLETSQTKSLSSFLQNRKFIKESSENVAPETKWMDGGRSGQVRFFPGHKRSQHGDQYT